ncbi:(2Fe-2S)-binding protein [Sunxiuqinia sp. A32]|uniref:(2Fe-2S)-binding protein n=1 Tax=Sunxiuqinia sp. A32 TaxID=3461496 RepID=UPI00404650E2
MEEKIQFELNGKPVEVLLDKNQTLLWALRTHFNLTGTKYGCGQGDCGACTVIVNNEAVRSCLLSMGEVKNAKIITIEGLADNGELHPIQKAFMEHDALQCGYCTPGMIMNAYGLLLQNPEISRDEIITGMEDNFCRCGAHNRIIDAVEAASEEMKSAAAR